VERRGAKGVSQRLLIPAGVEPRVPSWARGSLLVQRLLWPRQGDGRRVEARCGHEGLWMLLSSRHGPGYIVMCPCHEWSKVGHGALVRPLEPVGAVVWLEEPPRPPLPVLFLPLCPPPLPLLWFLL
jgi:hypothetical protein